MVQLFGKPQGPLSLVAAPSSTSRLLALGISALGVSDLNVSAWAGVVDFGSVVVVLGASVRGCAGVVTASYTFAGVVVDPFVVLDAAAPPAAAAPAAPPAAASSLPALSSSHAKLTLDTAS